MTFVFTQHSWREIAFAASHHVGAVILKMSKAQVLERLAAMEEYALRLGWEEAAEMCRGRALDVFQQP